MVQRLILLSARVEQVLISQRNVTYSVSMKRNVGAAQSKATGREAGGPHRTQVRLRAHATFQSVGLVFSSSLGNYGSCGSHLLFCSPRTIKVSTLLSPS
jgi:hypothetical protein